MPDTLLLVVAFFGTALLSFALTPLAAKLVRRLGVVDRPDERKTHSKPVPLVGGVAVSLGLLGGALAYGFVMGWDSLISHLGSENEGPLLWGCAIVLVVGLVDDARGLTAIVRVAVEASAAVIVMQAGYMIDSIWTPWGVIQLGLASYPITILWFVGVANSFNLIDGLDGLMSLVAIASLAGCAAIGFSVSQVMMPLIPIAVAGALAGFLPWNRHPARAFLGDAGSLILEWARQNFDYVVIDSPPVAAVTDASVLAPQVDAILMVVRAERTPRRAVSHGRELLENAKGRISGAILNDMPRKHGGYYGYGYYRYGRDDRYYGRSEEEDEQKKQPHRG